MSRGPLLPRTPDTLPDRATPRDRNRLSSAEPYTARVPDPTPVVRLRLSAYVVLTRDDRVLLTRISSRGHHIGHWTLPGGGVDHGEPPRTAAAREVREETGLDVEIGALLDVHDSHFTGHAPDGTLEDFHGVHLIFGASTPTPDAALRILEADSTTDAVEWVDRAAIEAGDIPVLGVVHAGLAALGRPSLAAESVAQFHSALGITDPDRPAGPVPSWRERLAFLEEETREYAAAAEAGDVVEVADALADLLYVVHGTALVHGIPLDAVFAEVHRSNMTKVDGQPIGPGTKAPKPEGYRAPRIRPLLER
jgi:8-oxo-dGTP pyrophosphatase MutT (NUDIX family)/predicted HAD superfamily Cof-like phosphohydrolase